MLPGSANAAALRRAAIDLFTAERAASVYTFDLDAQLVVSAARESLPTMLQRRVSFAVHVAEALDVPRQRFDIALCGWSS